MNYTSRYGLEFNPFIKNSKSIHINTDDYQEIEYRLNNLLNTKGFGLITGAPGRGKTTALRQWVSKLNTAAYKVIYLSLSTLTVLEFYRQLTSELGIEPYHRKSDNFKAVQGAVNRYVIEKRMTPIIILDEANYIKNGILNDLKILFNFDMDSSDKAVILLVGLPQLNNTLRLNVHEPLKQRIVMNYHIDSLSKDESKKYIKEKIKGAGCHQLIFEESALEAIANSSNGVPRVINRICDNALMIGNIRNTNIIDSDIIMAAVNEMEID